MRYEWLSYPLDVNGPRPPAIPAAELSDLYTVAKDGANVQILRLANHTGTHLDSPRHVVEDGVVITDYSPLELIFTKPVVIDIHLQDEQIVMPADLKPYAEKLKTTDIALFRFGYGAVRRESPTRFANSSPGFGVESTRWLRHNCPDLRAMGLDVPSIATIAHLDTTMAAHNELLAGSDRRFIIIEEMDLNKDLTGLAEVRVNPWLVDGMDSGPCTIVGVFG